MCETVWDAEADDAKRVWTACGIGSGGPEGCCMQAEANQAGVHATSSAGPLVTVRGVASIWSERPLSNTLCLS